MFCNLKRVLVIFLALLQFVAPLVHAHAGEKKQSLIGAGSAKLHIPGLEAYGVESETLMLDSVGHQYSAEGIIISVDAGIKHEQATLFIDFDNNYALPQPSLVFEPTISPFDTNFSPHVPIRAGSHLISSHTPRAPPAL